MLFSVVALLAACDGVDAPPDGGMSPWSQTTPLPTPRLEPGVAALGQRIAVLGGFDRSEREGLRITSDVVVFDPVRQAWEQVTNAPVEWTHANLAGVSTTLYLLGGLEGIDFRARGESFALDVPQPGAGWRALAPMPAGLERGAAAVVISPPNIFLLGGASSTEAVATNLVYDLTENTWTRLPDLPAPRSHAAAMRMIDGTLIIAGGLAGLDGADAYDDVWALPPGASQWEQRTARMAVARGGCAYGVVASQLVCAGGEAGREALTLVESYDPIQDEWTRHPDLPEPRAGTPGAAVGTRLYVPGGASRLVFDPTSTVFVFSYLETLAR